MKNTFTQLKQVIVCCAVACFLPNLNAQQMESAPTMLAEYELVNDVEIYSYGMTNITAVYRKKAATPTTGKAGIGRGKASEIEPPMVIIIDENGCETGCTEHGWGSMGCLLKNKDNLPKSFRLGSDGHFYQEGKKAPITEASFSKFTLANKSGTDPRHILRRKQNAGSSTNPASIWVTICNPKNSLNCDDFELLLTKKHPKTGEPLQNFSNGTVSFRFGDTKTYCLLPNGTVSNCDWLPTREELSRM